MTTAFGITTFELICSDCFGFAAGAFAKPMNASICSDIRFTNNYQLTKLVANTDWVFLSTPRNFLDPVSLQAATALCVAGLQWTS